MLMNSGSSKNIIGGILSGVIVVNFAASVIGSVISLPSNNAECTKTE